MLTWLSSWPLPVETIEQIVQRTRRRVREVVRERADFLHHVERPEDVDVVLAGQLLVLERTVVLVVVESLDVHRQHDGAVRHEVGDALVDHERRRRDALERPVVRAARRQLLERRLPHELAVGLPERHHDAAIARLLRIAHRFVVGADQHDAAGDDRIAVALRSQRRDPLDVLAGLDIPRRRQARWRRRPCCGRASRPTSATSVTPLPAPDGDRLREPSRPASADEHASRITILASPLLVPVDPEVVEKHVGDPVAVEARRAVPVRDLVGLLESSRRPAPASPTGQTLP